MKSEKTGGTYYFAMGAESEVSQSFWYVFVTLPT